MRRRLVIVGLVLGLVGGALAPAGASESNRTPRVPGMVITQSTVSFDQTWNTLIGVLDANPNIGVVATLDHAANAARVGEHLRPTREVFFGNPNLGTPIMQTAQNAGIDLPQKMLVWEDARGRVFVGYNSPAYVAARHGAGSAPTLDVIDGALATIAGAATGVVVDGNTRRLRFIAAKPGLVSVDSAYSADETFDRLLAVIEAAPPNVLFALEHDQNAAGAGLDLAPTKLIVFGNPVLGTPLMQDEPTIGIDLPQKFLVVERPDGSVQILYNDPHVIARRHRIRGHEQLLDTIAGALSGLAHAAGG